MTYSSGAAAALGSLLRKAQEDRQAGPHLVPQSAQEESPIRQQITGPIAAPESVGSEKVVSMKGEMQPIQEGATQAPINVDGNVSPVVVPPIVPPVSGMEGSAPSPVTPSSLASSVTSSGIGSPLLPSSMKPGAGKSVAQGNVVSPQNYSAAPNFSLGQPLFPSAVKQSRQLAGRVSADYTKATPAELANATSVRQNPTTEVQKKAGQLGGAIDWLGQKLGNIIPEKNISEKLENWGGSRTVAATKPTFASVLKNLFRK